MHRSDHDQIPLAYCDDTEQTNTREHDTSRGPWTSDAILHVHDHPSAWPRPFFDSAGPERHGIVVSRAVEEYHRVRVHVLEHVEPAHPVRHACVEDALAVRRAVRELHRATMAREQCVSAASLKRYA